MFFILFGVIGLIFGSFGTVLVDRIPKGEPIGGRSHCERCRRTLRWRDLVPLLSFLFLRGRCGSCGHRMARWYPVMEAGSAFLFIYALMITKDPVASIALAMALWILWVIAWIDARMQQVPDALTGTLLGVTMLYALMRGDVDFLSPLIAIVFFGVQWAVSRGRILGSGDMIVAGASGFLFADWTAMALAIASAYIFGAIACVILLLFGAYKGTDRIAFMPFWLCGILLTLALHGHYPMVNILRLLQ